ncbi:MAG: hypothetical protein NUW01_18595 [Gemmatimonadaceae bacterium]|nr:hypothetical protein [Gemmatimonadaceae bacterium]
MTVGYVLSSESYVMPGTNSGEYRVSPRDFRFAIRRRDGSLVFRTQTVRLANEILENLNGNVLRSAA